MMKLTAFAAVTMTVLARCMLAPVYQWPTPHEESRDDQS
jgi:hypothetical protein